MNNETNHCPFCGLKPAKTQERKYKNVAFHKRCLAILQKRASFANTSVEIATGQGNDPTYLVIEPEGYVQRLFGGSREPPDSTLLVFD